MSEPLGLFHTELFTFLQGKWARPLHLEQKLLEAIPFKLYRGIPRLYYRDNPAISRVKPGFTDLFSLKKLLAERFLFPLYASSPVPEGTRVALFSFMRGGMGDWIAGKEVLALLKQRFPTLRLDWVVLLSQEVADLPAEAIPIRFSGEVPLIVGRPFSILEQADLLLFLPACYPHIQELVRRLPPSTRTVCLGEYGFLETGDFHPQSGHRSLGLHFLEKGVLIRGPFYEDFATSLKNREILSFLFGEKQPGPREIERFLEERHFYLAYLATRIGGAVYLHALLYTHARDPRPLDLCVPDVSWLMAHIQEQNRLNLPVLEGDTGVQFLEIHFEGKMYRQKIGERGKVVRILCPGPIADRDFRLLLRLSGDFVGIRGNQSFSEAVSANRVFFYDGLLHARYFMKDLLALAENRLAAHRGALALFRGMGKAFLHHVPQDEEELWVDETHFQMREPWRKIAEEMGSALGDPDTRVGVQKLNKIVREEHACNAFLCQLVQRELVLCKSGDLARFEKERGQDFYQGRTNLELFLTSMRSFLQSEKPNSIELAEEKM